MKKGYLVMAIAASVAAYALPAQASQDLIKKARCNACHAVDVKRVGPGYREVAEKYRGQAAAPQQIFDKIRNGGAGTWGQIPMPPHGADKISDGDLKTVVQWILAGAAG